ncbi:MAG: hypothetical protein VB050_11070 [Geobacteraceae bacterium]|nr:hypothetical protein [Geobacteraceae bacterium]
MKTKNCNNDRQREIPARKTHVRRAVTIASVAASLAASLGINVGDLIAADQCKDAATLQRIPSEQQKISVQFKQIKDRQDNLARQLDILSHQGKVSPSQIRDLQTMEGELSSQIKRVRDNDRNLSSQINEIRRNNVEFSNNVGSTQAKESTISNQIKGFEDKEANLRKQLRQVSTGQK